MLHQNPLALSLVTMIAAGAATVVIPTVTSKVYQCVSEAMSVASVRDQIVFVSLVLVLAIGLWMFLSAATDLSSDDPW